MLLRHKGQRLSAAAVSLAQPSQTTACPHGKTTVQAASMHTMQQASSSGQHAVCMPPASSSTIVTSSRGAKAFPLRLFARWGSSRREQAA